MVSVRERIAIVFMTVSVLATLVLGGAVAYDLSRPRTTRTVVASTGGTSGSVTEDVAAGDQTAVGTDTGSATAAATGPSAAIPAQGPSMQTATAKKAATASSGQLSTSSQGVTGDLITVGGIYDETGPLDATVERDTVRAYFNKVNAAGGINGRKFQLIECDSGYDPAKAHACSQRLLSQGVLAIVGPASASGEQAETQFFNDQGVPLIGGVGVPSQFQVPLSFPTTASLAVAGTGMGTHAKDLKMQHPAVVVVTVPFIKPVEDAVLAALHKQGIKEASVEEVDATKPDYTDLAIKIRSEGADSIIAGLDPYSYARFFQALDRQNFHPPFQGIGLDKGSANKQYGGAAYGAESLTPMTEPQDHPNDPGVREYLDTVHQYYPGQMAALDIYSEGDWVAAKVFVEAVRRIGTQPVTRKSLVDALTSIKDFQTGLSVPISYGPGNHDPLRCFQWIHDVNATWTTYSDWNCF